MNLIISDTGPLSYLILIGQIHVLRELFGTVAIPSAVLAELSRPKTPELVRDWIAARPDWLVLRAVSSPPPTSLAHLDPGEREAIMLAEEL